MDRRCLSYLCLLLILALSGCTAGGNRTVQPAAPSAPAGAETNKQPPADKQTETSAAKDPAELVKQADSLIVAGQHAQAVELLISVVGDFPENGPAWDLLSYAYARSGRFKASQAAGERAAFLAPDSAAVRFNAGLANARAKAFARAAEHLEQAVRLNDRQSDPSYYLGAVYESLGQRDQAARVYQQALAKFPADNDLKRAAAALANDLTLDGKPEQIAVVGGQVVVLDGGNKQELLRQPAGAGTQTRVVDLAGPAPALLVQDPVRITVFVGSAGKGLVEAGQERIDNLYYDAVERALVDRHETDGTALIEVKQLQGAKLTVTRQWTQPARPAAPASRPALFESVLSLNPLAFTEGAYNDLVRRLSETGQQAAAFPILLPASDGTFRFQIAVSGRVIATGKAQLTPDGLKVAQILW